MIFLTYEPYTDNVEPKGNECFICYEYLLDNKYSKKMSSILEYCKSCDCDVYVQRNLFTPLDARSRTCAAKRNPTEFVDTG